MIRSCTVKVHFKEIIDDGNEENPEGYRDVPDSKLVVSRTAFKDNSSYYEINGRRATFKDVAKLLRKKGVDLDHNRFLILQVKYSSVSLSKILTNGEYVTTDYVTIKKYILSGKLIIWLLFFFLVYAGPRPRPRTQRV